MNSKTIKINVGGRIFETTEDTLLKSEYFNFFIKRFPLKNKDLNIFIDRSPYIFKHVLSLMRDNTYIYPFKYLNEIIFYGVNINDDIIFSFKDINIKEYFFSASKIGNTFIVKMLIKHSGIDPSIDDNYAFSLASEYGRYKTVELLLKDYRVDPSADNNLAIGLASKNGRYKTVELLLNDDRVDPSSDNDYAL